MTSWKEPSLSYPILTLPKAVVKSPVLPSDLERIDAALSLPVTDQFLSVWLEGPKTDTAKECTRCLRILVETFSELLLAGRKQVAVTTKADPTDFVTEMDQGLEVLFRVWLNRFYPQHKIIGEEGFKDHIEENDVVWYIDPIDGTSNFVEGNPEYVIQIGSVYQGKPYVSLMAVPAEGLIISGNCEQEGIEGLSVTPFDELRFGIGTEFREFKKDEAAFFDQISQELEADQVRYKSIGYNLLAMIRGNSWAFYKPDLKYWDALGPLCLIYFAAKAWVTIDFYIPQSIGHVSANNKVAVNVFGHDEPLLSRLNKKHQDDCRIGYLFVTPSARPDLREYLHTECLNPNR